MKQNRKARRVADAKAKRRRVLEQRRAESLRKTHERSQSRGLQAVKALDPFDHLRGKLREIAGATDSWAGIPMPLDDQRLVIEPTYPYAALAQIGEPADVDNQGWTFGNRFYSRRWRADVQIVFSPEGRASKYIVPAVHSMRHALQTLGASDAWGIEQEQKALQLLGTMIRHRSFKQYLLTGMFLEKSPRSGITYLFRRLRPTVACAPGRRPEDSMRILCALCMHPIAYYADSWAGAMCPTDDVIAHLALMRGDEVAFWKRCSQHQPHRPEAGL